MIKVFNLTLLLFIVAFRLHAQQFEAGEKVSVNSVPYIISKVNYDPYRGEFLYKVKNLKKTELQRECTARDFDQFDIQREVRALSKQASLSEKEGDLTVKDFYLDFNQRKKVWRVVTFTGYGIMALTPLTPIALGIGGLTAWVGGIGYLCINPVRNNKSKVKKNAA
ncbi:hypothetical protein [Persicobacter diffluens]|uniref:Uncharacterized protein n=1 Tax=Persicobacter diffluens TaxID=981 RepID=A0AAN4W6P9_9BACT|nr:hypothetical protein PEDI_56570 [Persicobacter diffluens]